MPVPSTAGWLMPSLKPNDVRSVGGTCTSCRQIGATPGTSRSASRAPDERRPPGCGVRGQRGDREVDVRAAERWLPVLGRALARRRPARPPARPCPARNSGGKLARVRCGTPSALRPWNVSATAAQSLPVRVQRAGSRGHDRDEPPQQLPAVAPVVDAHEDHRADIAGGARVQQRSLDVVDLQRDRRLRAHSRRSVRRPGRLRVHGRPACCGVVGAEALGGAKYGKTSDAGCVACSTPSLTGGPLPALMRRV